MLSMERYSSVQSNDLENKEQFYEKQHLSDDQMQKLRNVTKTKIAGELTIKSSDLERTFYLAGQNLPKKIIEKIQNILEETYHTDEYFLDEIEYILAPYWEDLTTEEISQLLIESFEIFDIEKQGFINKQDLIHNLTTLGDMPLNKKDFQIIFSIMKNSKFNYHEFVKKLCGLDTNKKKKKKKKKKKMKVQRTIK